MQSDAYYILVVSFYCLIIGFIVPRLFRLKFLPIGYLLLGGVSAILGPISQLFIYGVHDDIWAKPQVGIILSTIVCLAITTIIFIRKKYSKGSNEDSLKIKKSNYAITDIRDIKSLIAENDIEKACEKLIVLTEIKGDRKKEQRTNINQGKIQKIKSDNRIGVLTNDEKDIGYSRISYSLLEIADSL